MAEAKTEAPAGDEKKRSLLENKAVVLGGIVVAQVVLAIALTQLVIVPRLGSQAAEVSPTSPSGPAALPEIGVIVSLQEVIATLPSPGPSPRYLRLTPNLEVADQATADMVAARLPQLRDIVIMTASQKSADELISPEGKKGLRDELLRRLAEKLPAEKLRSIYFSDLVIQ